MDRRVSRRLRFTSLLILTVGSFDQLAVDEEGTGADECDQVRRVDHPPPGLGCLDQLERHGHAGGPAAGTLGDSGSEPNGGEGRLDRVTGPEVDPVLGRVVVKRQQDVVTAC